MMNSGRVCDKAIYLALTKVKFKYLSEEGVRFFPFELAVLVRKKPLVNDETFIKF